MMGFLATVITTLTMAAAPVVGPPTAGVADYQLGGAYPPAASVQIVTRDRTAKPVEGLYSICYINAFQTQPGTLHWWKKNHPALLLRDSRKRLVSDPGWPDEVLLDLRTRGRREALATLVGSWFKRCAADGFQASEPDNLDSWTRSRRLLTPAQAITFSRLMVARAHSAGLAIAQKNTPELSTRGLGFDFAVAEECEVYRECGDYTKVYRSRLIEIEYADNGKAAFTRACSARKGKASILLRDRDVVPRGSKHYVFRHC